MLKVVRRCNVHFNQQKICQKEEVKKLPFLKVILTVCLKTTQKVSFHNILSKANISQFFGLSMPIFKIRNEFNFDQFGHNNSKQSANFLV